MTNSLGSDMLQVAINLFSRLPFALLYLLGDLFAWLAYHVTKYRRAIVFANLENSFPQASKTEIRQMARDFYRHFFQTLVEMLKAKHFEAEDWHKRVRATNPEILAPYLNRGQSIILMKGHVANWEWAAGGVNTAITHPLSVLYKRIKDPVFAKLMHDIRSRGGVNLVEKDSALRYLVKTKNDQQIIGIISDQIPSKGAEKYWINFLNQETAFYRGAEKFAKLLKTPVFYLDMRKSKRGFYQISFEELYDGTSDLSEGKVIHRYAKKLEETITARPSDYLWSHRRWKYTKEEAMKVTGNPFKIITD